MDIIVTLYDASCFSAQLNLHSSKLQRHYLIWK